MTAAGILFGEGSKSERERAYADHMAALYEKYPDNRDVAAFYALSLLIIVVAAAISESLLLLEKRLRRSAGVQA